MNMTEKIKENGMNVTAYKVYRVKGDVDDATLQHLAQDIQKGLDLENVHIDKNTKKLSYDNPRNCRVDEQLLLEAVKQPGKNINFELCD